jgi:hypothetical protein
MPSPPFTGKDQASTHLFPCCSTSIAKQNDKKKPNRAFNSQLGHDKANFFQNSGEFFKKSRFFVNKKKS